MARPDAVAVGLFFPTPTHLLAPIASLIAVGSGEDYSIVDPCAADGAAVIGIAKALARHTDRPLPLRSTAIYACEMERTRYEALRRHEWGQPNVKPLHGDAMRLSWSVDESYGEHRTGASLAFINPPYDTDREFKRLEERFLRRFCSCIAEQGVLVWLVPYYTLSASADTIARNFTSLSCYRFPDPDFEVFKQVVLVGVKRPMLAEPDPSVRIQVMQWSASPDSMPILGSASRVVEMPGHASYKSGFSKWEMAPLDLRGLTARIVPWCSSDRAGKLNPIAGVVPHPGDLLARRYPLAVPPKPAHLAAAIASGVFNGAEVRPDDPASRLPRLRVKGVFDKEFVKVEDKTNKDGAKTAEIQVQQPKLVVTVLDCSTGTYHTLKPSAETTDAKTPAEMSTGDLLTHYGRALMQVMLDQCPVLHDPSNPAHEIQLPPLARKLYRAQAHAVMALVKLVSPEFAELRRAWDPRRNGEPENGLLLGEIGVGKSTVADATFEYLRWKGFADQALIMCPPHLQQSWADQVKAVTPHLPTRMLDSVHAVDEAANDTEHGVRILSRETAKLSHAFQGVSGPCPRCGVPLPVSSDGIPMAPEELARKRMRCQARPSQPTNEIARIADAIAIEMMLVAPHSPDVNQRCRGRHRDRMMILKAGKIDGKQAFKHDPVRWSVVRPRLVPFINRLALAMIGGEANLEQSLLGMLAGVNDDAVTRDLCERVYAATMFDTQEYGPGERVRSWVRDALLLISFNRQATAERLKAMGLHPKDTYSSRNPWTAWSQRALQADDPESYRTGLKAGSWAKHPLGSPACVAAVLALLAPLSSRSSGPRCNEPLYQAIPEPRRVALAKYLTKRAPDMVDFFILDEAHEAANGDSAQSQAAHRIVGMGVPTIALTGSVMNGYAVSLYANQQALDPMFREEFPRVTRVEDDGEKREVTSGLREFNRRYGYIKQLVQQTDKDGKVVEWGSQSDRRETVREIGNAPGVLPLFTLRYLLRTAVPLQMSDLAIDLPAHHEIVESVEPSAEILAHYRRMEKKLRKQIKEDRFDPLLAGKLFGQMSEIGSYLDRATRDTGNSASGDYEVRYPENEALEAFSGRVIDHAPGLPESTILPKERWMLETIEREHREGRRVMIFAWHEAVLPRLARLVESELGEPCALLLSKVQAKKRQDWIDQHVIAKKRRDVVLNPACVKTGLNNLVWFQTVIWMENPAVDPQTYRQATGRINRIGKTAESRAYFPVYEGTAQVLAHRLLLHKVAVSMATDGLDAESALQAAGVGTTDTVDAMSVGRALFEMMERGEEQRRSRPPVAEPKPANDVKPEPARLPEPRRKPAQLDLFGKVA